MLFFLNVTNPTNLTDLTSEFKETSSNNSFQCIMQSLETGFAVFTVNNIYKINNMLIFHFVQFPFVYIEITSSLYHRYFRNTRIKDNSRMSDVLKRVHTWIPWAQCRYITRMTHSHFI